MLATCSVIATAVPAIPLQAHQAALNDAQIAHIAFTAGQLDVEAARQALDRSRNPEVRAFAETMIRDHSAVNEQALALLTRLGVSPEANPTSEALAEDAREVRERLENLDGEAFDRAYVEREAAFHATVNDALRTTLIPSAHNGDLKGLLEQGLALFSSHQEHAETLVRDLR